MAINVWAFDDGYGDNKLYDGENDIIIPALTTNWIKQLRHESALGDNKKVDPLSHIGIEIDGIMGKFLVGEGATQDISLNWVGGSNKHKDLNFPILAKACLGVLSGNSNKVTVEPLVMGLPVDEDESKERHDLLKGLMEGTHKMTLHLADGRELKKEITIKELVTKKQPFGSFCDMILNEEGGIANKEMAASFTVIVDIGTRTLNVYTLDALNPITDLSKTFNKGIHVAYGHVNDIINNELGFKLATGKVSDAIKRGKVGGMKLGDATKRSYQMHANEIYNIVDTMLVDSWVYVDNLIITGGGSELLKPYLHDLFPVKPLFLSRYSTARGFWKYGVRHAIQGSKTPVQIALPSGAIINVGGK